MKPTNEILHKYASQIANSGACIQKGQIVSIYCAVEIHDFAVILMEECYKAGARKVTIEWSCGAMNRINYTYAEDDVLAELLPWEEEKLKQRSKDLPVMIHILSEDPDALAGVDVDKMSRIMKKRMAVTKPYSNEIAGKYQWVGAGYPTVAWAKKIFPELPDEEAFDKLWESILKAARVDEVNDPVEVWKKHTENLISKAKWLTEQQFVSMKYKSANGTDFEVGLIPGACFENAGMLNPVNNVFFTRNIPTEEVFTTPMAGKCEGTLVATKPLSWNGQLIEDFSITFENGRAVSCKAARGQELLEKMIHMDDHAAMLGEVALVPKESPINQLGFLFYNTLFDENACCHMALGRGFQEVLPNGSMISVEEAEKQGVNDSMIHVDFMVGSDDLSIVGIKADGTKVPVFVNGTWA